MTKEELEKEAKTNISNLKNNALKISGRPFQISDGDYIQGYLDGAEPREKRIEELEKKLEQTEKDLADYQFNYPTIKELQKENEQAKRLLMEWYDRTVGETINCLRGRTKDFIEIGVSK